MGQNTKRMPSTLVHLQNNTARVQGGNINASDAPLASAGKEISESKVT